MDELFSVSDAARMLGVAPTTVRLMEQTGKLTALRTAGGMRLFRREDVERMVHERAERCVGSRYAGMTVEGHRE